MDFDHNNVRSMINEDRLSSLPDELIHQILSFIDTKFAVQTCLLSSRWKLLWTSMPYLNFASGDFVSLPKFSKFVTHFLSNRNHQIEVISVRLSFHGAASQVFVRKIANYAFSHKVQELSVVVFPKKNHEFPPCLFSSQSLKRFTLRSYFFAPCVTPKTPWDFPSLTSLHLKEVTLCDEEKTYKSVDLFSKCVNLKNLTLQTFFVHNFEVFDIIAPRLSDLTLIDGRNLKVINLVAPQLENLTIVDCSIKNPIAPPRLSTLCYRGFPSSQLSKEGFHSLSKVTIYLYTSIPCEEKDARKTINLLQEVHNAQFLTLNTCIIECISSFPDLLAHHPSPFSNLICLNIDAGGRKDVYKVKISTQVINFLLENSPSATFIMDLPEGPFGWRDFMGFGEIGISNKSFPVRTLAPPPTKSTHLKEAREKRMALLVADIEAHMTELQASLELKKTQIEKNKQHKSSFENLVEKLRVLIKQKTIQIDQPDTQESHKAGIEVQMQVDQKKAQIKNERVLAELMAQINESYKVIWGLFKQETKDAESIDRERALMKYLFKGLTKRKRAEIGERYYHVFEEFIAQNDLLISEMVSFENIINDYEKFMSDNISMLQDISRCKIPLASQLASSSSSSAIIPTPSTSNTNSMP